MRDQVHRDRICSDLHSNLLVEASAGSGKTSSLTQRIVAGLREGVYDPQRMAAVTFTKKAAAELRGRLRVALEDELLLGSSPRLLTALEQLDSIFIGTIHSFCSRLLRQYPVEAGVTPGFREIEEDEEEALRLSVFHRCLDEKPGRELQAILADAGVRPTDLTQALKILCAYGDARFEAAIFEVPDFDAAWAQVRLFCEQLGPDVPPRRGPCKELHNLHAFLTRYRQENREPRDLMELFLSLEKSYKPTLWCWGGRTVVDRFVPRVEAFRRDTIEPFLRHWRSYLYGQCLPFLNSVRDACEAERSRLGVLTFQDQLLGAARMLRTSAWARERLAEKFPHVFVDEFQDTDPIQAEVFFRLAAQDGGGEDWGTLSLRPGALFLVGDPKQSIYRFRRADIEVYNRVRERMEVVPLSTSFRSVPAVCNWVNRVFGELFPPDGSEHQAAFAGLEPRSEAEVGGVLALSTECERYGDCARLEAPRIAEAIRVLHDREGYRWGDFMVLTAKKDELSLYVDALRSLDIPYESSGGKLRPEPHFLELLACLVDPRDAVRLVGVLRGPLFGLSDEQLFAHVQAGGVWSFWASDGESEVLDALGLLRTWREWLDELPVGAALERILSASGLLASLGSEDELRGSGLLAVVDRLRLTVQGGVPLGEAVVSESMAADMAPLSLQNAGARCAVRLMNLHQAKGLEARVVFLASPCGGYGRRVSHRVSHGRGWLPITRPYGRHAVKAVAEPPDWEEHCQAEDLHLEAEQDRLLYVAATRARELLIVSRWTGTHGSARRPWGKLEPFLHEEFRVAPLSSFGREVVARDDAPEVASLVTAPSWERVGMKALARCEQVMAVDGSLTSGPGGAEWGKLVHRLLEHAVRVGTVSDRAELERLASWYAFETPEVDGLSEAVDLVLDVMARPVWSELLASRERWVEVPIGVRVDSVLAFGVLDVVLGGEGERWSVLDWKTDRVGFAELMKRYQGQLAEYVRAWGEVVGGEVHGRLEGVRR